MAKSKQQTAINLAPFPPLRWVDHNWTAEVNLPAWDGIQMRHGPFAVKKSQKQAKIKLRVNSPNEGEQAPPTPAQQKAYERLLAKQDKVRDALLKALLKHYQEARPDYEDFLGEEFDELMPDVKKIDGFRDLIVLAKIYLQTAEKKGLAYIGYGLDCTWDGEHGLGVLMHGERVVDIGGEDTAFLGWNADQDAEED
jgi:hypothetical protein